MKKVFNLFGKYIITPLLFVYSTILLVVGVSLSYTWKSIKGGWDLVKG